jgi:hypothetical protein
LHFVDDTIISFGLALSGKASAAWISVAAWTGTASQSFINFFDRWYVNCWFSAG